MSKKTYRGKYRGKSEIGYKSERRGWLGFWINLNLIINLIIIAGMISAVFSFESVLGSADVGAYSWARWVLYAVIGIYIALFIHLVVFIRKDVDDSRAQMRLFNYRSISVIARKILTILYTVFSCFILVDSWISGVVGSETLIVVIGIIVIAFYVLMIAVDIFKIFVRRKNYENTKKRRHIKKGRLQTMRKDLECQQALIEQKIIETRALKGSMVFRLLSINKNRYTQTEVEQDYLPKYEESLVSDETTAAVAAAGEMIVENRQPPVEPKDERAEEPELISVTMEELQQIAVVSEDEETIAEDSSESNTEIDESQLNFADLEPQRDENPDGSSFVASTALARDFADIFDFTSHTGV